MEEGMISMKFPLFTYICVLGNWYNDLLPKLLHGTIMVQNITALLGADLTSLVSYYLYAIARDQQPNWRKKRREWDREKRRDPVCSSPSPLALMFYVLPLLREDWERVMARWEWNSASAEKSAPGHTQNIICLQKLFFLTINFNFCKRFSWL